MSTEKRTLKNAPIVEAVLDIDCDLLPNFSLKSIEKEARDFFRSEYPRVRPILLQKHQIKQGKEGPPEFLMQQFVKAVQFLKPDEKQIVQVRMEGYSFNRLAPYSSLDEYYSEIERTWEFYSRLVQPVRIKRIALRFINRVVLPLENGVLDLDNYLTNGPKMAFETDFIFNGFLHQHILQEKRSGNEVHTTLASQPIEENHLPLILDITAVDPHSFDNATWSTLREKVEKLRDLKNRIFWHTLTERCLNQYQ